MKKQIDLSSIVIELTSTENLYLVHSSNGYDVYGAYFTGPDAVLCSCPAGSVLRPCKHRSALLARYNYVTQLDETLTDSEWQEIKQRIEDEACKAAYDELFAPEAA